MGGSAVQRFHRTLVGVVRKTRPEYLKGSFTVAEIYQTLVPYRSHRAEIGVELNGDYEDALLRLLAGEDDLLVLESEAAQNRIRDELKQADPNTGIYREFAAMGVRLNPARIPETDSVPGSASAPAPSAPAPSPSAPASTAPAPTLAAPALDLLADVREGAQSPSSAPPAPSGPAAGSAQTAGSAQIAGSAQTAGSAQAAGSGPAGPPPSGPAVRPTSPASGTPAASMVRPSVPPPEPRVAVASTGGSQPDRALTPSPAGCPECDDELPNRPGLRYCPFCGVDVYRRSCAGCGEELERAWRFCVTCGVDQRMA
jgi:hypothetical protein